MSAIEVSINSLDSWLQSQPVNSVNSPYELKILDIVESDLNQNGVLATILNNNSTKYVDLRETILPPVTNMFYFYAFKNCTSLVYSPAVPTGVMSMQASFRGCTSLKEAPVIPNNIDDINSCFRDCTSLISTPVFEEVTNPGNTQYIIAHDAFRGCTSLVSFGSLLPDKISNFEYGFEGCSSLVETPLFENNARTITLNALCLFMNCTSLTTINNLPQNGNYGSTFANCTALTDLSSLTLNIQNHAPSIFLNCTSLTKSPTFMNVQSLQEAFKGCTSLIEVQEIPNSVISCEETFSGCIALETPPIFSTVQSGCSFKKAFYGCISLTRTPEIPSGVTDLTAAFAGCISLTSISSIPQTVQDLTQTFASCTGLVEFDFSVIPNTIISFFQSFYGCTSLHTIKVKEFTAPSTNNYSFIFYNCQNLTEFKSDTPYELKSWLETIRNANTQNFPNSISDCHFYLFSPPNDTEIPLSSLSNELSALTGNTNLTPFEIIITGVTSSNYNSIKTALTSNNTKYVDLSSTIIPSVTDLDNTFENCVSLVKSPLIPPTVVSLDSTYKGCSNLLEAPIIPDSITDMPNAFEGCSSLVAFGNIPEDVVDLTETFKNCTNLEEIESFEPDPTILSTNASDCFSGCSSLQSIGIAPVDIETSQYWHIFLLKFGASSVEGVVFDRNGNETAISEIDISKSKLTLPILTDELWFPDVNYTDAEIKAIIGKMIQYKYGIFNKEVLAPDQKSFVLWKDAQSNFVSNISFPSDVKANDGGTPSAVLDTLTIGQNVYSVDGGGGVPVGFVGAYYGTTDPDGWLICNGRDTTGTDIELETNFPALYAFLGNSNVLPDLRKRFIEGADNDVGTYVAPGIPNITGTTQHVQYMGGASGSGAFSRGDSSSNNSAYNGNTTKTQRLSFNAKNGETKTDGTLKGANDTKVYGKSDTVQPASLRLNYIIKAK